MCIIQFVFNRIKLKTHKIPNRYLKFELNFICLLVGNSCILALGLMAKRVLDGLKRPQRHEVKQFGLWSHM